MKFALVDGQRQEAQPRLSGKCPACEHPMIARCGKRDATALHSPTTDHMAAFPYEPSAEPVSLS
jgi:hypothetical protein